MALASSAIDKQAECPAEIIPGDGTYDPYATARSIVGALNAKSGYSEKIRQLDNDSAALIKSAGLTRLLSPKKYGGYEFSPRSQILTCAITARGCSAASWVQMVCGAHSYVVGRFSEKCQDEVFGGHPDVLIPGTLAAQGTVRRADGGWLLNGRWQFGSGADHGPWFLMGARGVAGEGSDAPPPMHVVVPRSDMEVDDTWFTLGMRGTGSKDLVANDVFVPDYRAEPTVETFLGTFERPAGSLYRLPVMGGLASMLSGSVLGMAERGLDLFTDYTRVRADTYAGGAKAQKPGIQFRLAEASAEIALARKLVEENCDLLDTAMEAGHLPMPIEARARLKWNAAYSVELCRRAIEKLFAGSGAHAIDDRSDLQTIHRDINTACHHAIVDFDGALELRGRLMLGLDEGGLPV